MLTAVSLQYKVDIKRISVDMFSMLISTLFQRYSVDYTELLLNVWLAVPYINDRFAIRSSNGISQNRAAWGVNNVSMAPINKFDRHFSTVMCC